MESVFFDKSMQRSHGCSGLNAGNEGDAAVLNGWVHRCRDHGGVIFFNLRDRSGLMQCVVDDNADPALKERAAKLHMEQCVSVSGKVRLRPENMVNPDMATGGIELVVDKIELLNDSAVPPFVIEDGETQAGEENRLQYRYLDLRSGGMQRRIALRHTIAFAMRQFLVQRDFFEIETPFFIRSTPEGARDYLVPARLHPGSFYALPQSPQLYKQLLMVGGFERYFQIVRCFRDEDARGDRQPEFTQVDMEMSFVTQDDVMDLTEEMVSTVLREHAFAPPEAPFPRLTYKEAMNRYGSDKPDTRFALELADFSEMASDCGFSVFEQCAAAGGRVKLLRVPGGAERFSRKKIAELEEIAKKHGAKGLAWCKSGISGLEGGISKFLDGGAVSEFIGAEPGDALFFVADDWKTACAALGAVRLRVAGEMGLIEEGKLNFLWVVDFPLFEKNGDGGWQPMHHVFSMPLREDIPKLDGSPGEVRGQLYDLVLNGNEVAGGSVRIHDRELQQKVLDVIGFSAEKAEESFGFLLEAIRYGAPPHGGIAWGFDRLVMILAGCSSLKDVIAFPKNNAGVSLMDGAPEKADPDQLEELGIRLAEPRQE